MDVSSRLAQALVQHLEGGKPKAPEGTSVLWNTFMALSRARSCGPLGPNPISYPEIAAYAQLMRMPLEPHHVDALAAMDVVWMERAYRAARGAPDGVKTLRPRSEHALTPAMFDLSVR
ncbi:phage tail assembly chaperone [Salipiger bermudensis]|uniref:phage tail assembly chaperone n=1 Tax=Salipiger bermudensis TaxID=344736 RepID=UPI00351409B6